MTLDKRKKAPASAGSKAPPTSTGMSAAKLDADNESFKHATVSLDVSKAIVAARVAKGLNQKQLAQALFLPVQAITEIEQGRAIPNGLVLSKIESALGIRLPRPGKPAPKK